VHWTLRKKILLGYGIALALLVVVLALALTSVLRLGRASEAILSENYRSIRAAERMTTALKDQDAAVLSYLLGRREAADSAFRDGQVTFLQSLARARDNVTIEGEGRVVARIDSAYRAYLDAYGRLTLVGAPAEPAGGTPVTALNTYRTRLAPLSASVREAAARLRDLNETTMFGASDRAAALARRATWTLVAVGALVLLAGLAFSLILSRRLTRPLQALTQATGRIAAGDYDVKVPVDGHDELAELSRRFNEMAAELRSFRTMNVGQIVAAKRRSEAIVRSIHDGIVVVDGELRVVNLNPAARAILEVGGEEVRGRHVLELIHDETLVDPLRQAVEAGRAPDIPESRRYVTRTRAGAAHHFEVVVTPIRAETGEPAGGILMLRDVTQLKELDRMKSDFVATVSHELRTPLTSIGMSLDLLEERVGGQMDGEERELLGETRTDVSRLRDLVADLLELSRLESGRIELDFQPAPLRPMCEKASQILLPQAEERGVELELDLPGELPEVRADVNKVTWVLTNLLANAIRYSDRGGRVRVEAVPLESSVQVSVRDQGAGIPYEYQSRVFDRFVQVDGGRAGGTGLGLAICREVVRAHGGAIWLESTPGEGSVFTFTLPRA